MRVVDKKVDYAGLLCCRELYNSQTTPGITMHELPRNRPAVRRKWIKFIQFKRADFLAAQHHAHLCSEHFSECDFANPMEYRMSKLTRCSGTLSKSCLTGSNWYGCIFVGLSGKVSFSSWSSSWPFCSDSPEWRRRHMVTWFGRHGDAFSTTENAFFSCIYNPQITVSQLMIKYISEHFLQTTTLFKQTTLIIDETN